jgi:hypothetical protein
VEVEKEWGDNIEESINQMQLIESLHCDEFYEDLIKAVDEIKEKKVFLDSLKIPITVDQFEKFLSLYSFPLDLRRRVFS